MEDYIRVLFGDLEINLDKLPNPREVVNKKYVHTLYGRIKSTRQVVPIAVWHDEEAGKFIIADGLQRYFALEEFKEKDPFEFETIFGDGIPCQVLHGATRDAVITSIVFNIDRKNYTQTEMINACKILDDSGMSRDDIATCLRVSKRSVRRWMAFDRDATTATKKGVATGKVSIHAAANITGLDPEEQDKQLERVKEESEKSPKDRDMQKLANEMGKLAASGGEKGPVRVRKPSAKTMHAKLQIITEVQEEKILRAKRKPVNIEDIGADGSNAHLVVTYQQDVARLQGRIDALEWVLGKRQDLD